ncbi:MAG: PAS domain S-box protein [Candidatus Pacebacteria bacterium]|nr:PAS domain S-box protein [Candidatus Paceibacterota bacterium]
MSLNTKIVIIVMQVALIPWLVGGTLAFLASQEQVNAKTYTTLDSLAETQKNRLEDTLNNKLDILNLFTTSSSFVGALQGYNAQPTLLNKEKLQELVEAPGRAVGIRKLFLATTAGIVVASSDKALIGTDIQTEAYFKRGLHANDESVLGKDADGTVSQYLAGPLIADKTEGVAVVVTDADDIVNISHDFAGFGKTGETLVVTETSDGNALFLTPTRFDPSAALSRVVPASQMLPTIRAVRGEEALLLNAVDYRGIKVFAATRYIESTGWGIVVKIDQTEAYTPIRHLQELFLLIVSIISALIIAVAVTMSRSITGPVHALTAFANKIAQGDLNQSIVITSKDDVGILATTFNAMISKLQESRITLEQKVSERTKELAEKTEEAKESEQAAFNIAADLKDEEEKLEEEKMKAERLANDLKKFKLAIDNASDQIIITDPEGTVIYANAAVEKITGYKPEEALGKKSGVLWKSPMPKDYYENLWHTIKDRKETFIGEMQNKRKNGQLYTALINISPVLDSNDKIVFFVGIERDITKEKEIDTAKTEFISLASHQLRTPLTAINWYSEMLLGGDAGKMTAKQKEYFNEIALAGRQMNEIINSFLHVLRLETGTQTKNTAPTDLIAISRSIQAELQLQAERKKLRVVEKYQNSLSRVLTDADLARIIVQNFVSNALKYSKDGGEVVISLENVIAGESVAGKIAAQDSVLVAVHDSGIGVPESVKEKVFSKFYRADNAKMQDPNGNGLGLYMSKIMADIIGGIIWFVSKEGEGTTFYLLLPKEARPVV